jgi:hypothetical protein
MKDVIIRDAMQRDITTAQRAALLRKAKKPFCLDKILRCGYPARRSRCSKFFLMDPNWK